LLSQKLFFFVANLVPEQKTQIYNNLKKYLFQTLSNIILQEVGYVNHHLTSPFLP